MTMPRRRALSDTRADVRSWFDSLSGTPGIGPLVNHGRRVGPEASASFRPWADRFRHKAGSRWHSALVFPFPATLKHPWEREREHRQLRLRVHTGRRDCGFLRQGAEHAVAVICAPGPGQHASGGSVPSGKHPRRGRRQGHAEIRPPGERDHGTGPVPVRTLHVGSGANPTRPRHGGRGPGDEGSAQQGVQGLLRQPGRRATRNQSRSSGPIVALRTSSIPTWAGTSARTTASRRSSKPTWPRIFWADFSSESDDASLWDCRATTSAATPRRHRSSKPVQSPASLENLLAAFRLPPPLGNAASRQTRFIPLHQESSLSTSALPFRPAALVFPRDKSPVQWKSARGP